MAERSTATSPPQRPADSRQPGESDDAEDTEKTPGPGKSQANDGAKEGSGENAPPDAGSSCEQTAGAGAARQERRAAPDARAERGTARGSAHELHSGHRLARRYRLEECITRLDGFSSWRAVDEKLRRAVGVHVLPAGHERAREVLSAARSSALLGDPRFVQVLDADEDDDLVHVIHEWLPDATPLGTLLHTGPLEPHEIYALATQVAQAMSAAHREGLAHLRLTPATVLRTGPCQYRIRGLAVDAALRGITAERPQRTDTEAIGALLYTALTQRWPYAEDAYGLRGIAGLSRGSHEPPATPEQVRAGVHRGLSDLAMRALVNAGATAASEEQPCTTPEELCRAIARMPRIRPPEPSAAELAGYQRTTYQQGSFAPGSPHSAAAGPEPATAVPPALPGRTGAALKWGVSALLLAALGLGSWQLADALLKGDTPTGISAQETTPPVGEASEEEGSEPEVLPIEVAFDFDPFGSDRSENPGAVPNAVDGDPETSWHTKNYFGPDFGNQKPGVGLVLDLGEPRDVTSVLVDAIGEISAELRAAPTDAGAAPNSLDGFSLVAEGSGDSLTLEASEPVRTQYVLVWLTDIPQREDGNYRGRITNITVTG
ncbi:protein kinase family protein [Streptomyces sodiiphilus]|uniref:Protein kinase family protein n=1 Tax=Streptomyces sodiiphilus TaxID=226217 RepID=A0ABN2PJ15_9ACTN